MLCFSMKSEGAGGKGGTKPLYPGKTWPNSFARLGGGAAPKCRQFGVLAAPESLWSDSTPDPHHVRIQTQTQT